MHRCVDTLRGWVRQVLAPEAGPLVRRPTIGFLLLIAVLSPFAGDLFVAGDHALVNLAAVTAAEPTQFRIVRPTDAATVGDGNIVLVEAVAVDESDGVVDRVEFALGDDSWVSAQREADDPTRWMYLWVDPPSGPSRIRGRAYGIEGQGVVEQSVSVQVADVWSTPFSLDNPYAGAGSYHKGQVHMHSTSSFDGWRSLPPGNLALEYKRRGYHFIIMTDHDVVSYPREVEDRDFIVIPGYESTSDAGHITGAFAEQVVASNLPSQQRIDAIKAAGGLALLNHPSWQIGWSATDVNGLQGYLALEIYNGMTADSPERVKRNLELWQNTLNLRGWTQRIWSVAVDDAHQPSEIDRAWIVVKTPQLTAAAIRQGLEKGAFYSSNGPSFSVLGVLGGSITAASPEASTIRFIDQNMQLLAEGPATGASYRPRGTERWVRVEAIAADGKTAWTQPFWLLPNAPRTQVVALAAGRALVGETMPSARVHVSDNGQYLGSVVANAQGAFSFRMPNSAEGSHDYWVIASAPWPDQLNSPPTLLSYKSE